MSTHRIGLTMRGCRVGAEQRDSISRDWWDFTCQLSPNVQVIPIPNLGSQSGSWAQELNLSGLILSGGDDLGSYPQRDESERSLLLWAAEKNRPVLGVCRGMQMLCVHTQGALERCDPGVHCAKNHTVNWTESVEGLSASGDRWEVNSYHNFRVASLSNLWRVTALSEDGTVEAALHVHLPWMAVQWHPERVSPESERQSLLLKTFLGWCGK